MGGGFSRELCLDGGLGELVSFEIGFSGRAQHLLPRLKHHDLPWCLSCGGIHVVQCKFNLAVVVVVVG